MGSQYAMARPSPGSGCGPSRGTSSAAECRAPARRPKRRSMRDGRDTALFRSLTSPKTMASAGQVCWQAVRISPSLHVAVLALGRDLRRWMRCTQYVHFSITPRKRTVTFGFCCICYVSGSPPVSFQTDVVVPVEVVEPADLVRAVVRAVARADAPVVGHLVQALGPVRGGVDRADVLAGRLLAVHAHEGLGTYDAGSSARGARSRCARRSSGRCAASASRGRARPRSCRRPGRCSRTCTR